MEMPNKQDLEQFSADVDALKASLAGAELDASVGVFGQYLLDSEAQLVALMNETQPPEGGAIEFCLVLYWVYYDLPGELDFLKSYFPKPTITPGQLAQWETILEGEGRIYGDGTFVGYGRYEQLDKGWAIASVLYMLSLVSDWVPRACFGDTPAVIDIPTGQTVTVAVIGDWGTGEWPDQGATSPSQQVMDAVMATPPDYTIHLGDVYYAGSGNLSLKVNIALVLLAAKLGVDYDPSEETDRLIKLWKAGTKGTFTLNSNHEMYSGAQGYFNDALGASSELFAAQNKTSYFAINAPNWAIVGLDSAYFTSSLAYMEGRLQNDKDASQISFVQGLGLGSKTTIAMTHHTTMTYDGVLIKAAKGKPASACLWEDIQEAFNGTPDFYYWGHIHNGIVYSDESPLGMAGTAARCVGHGAIPFGKAYSWNNGAKVNLDTLAAVTNYSHTPLPNPTKIPQWDKRVLNGYALLTLSDASIIEEFYELGNTTAVWTKKTDI